MLPDATAYAARAHGMGLLLPDKEHGARWCSLVHSQRNPPPDDRTSTATAAARVHYGAWIVDCTCNGAQYACRTDRRLFCPDCGNRDTDGAWVSVIWPDDKTITAIEQALEQRPVVDNRNWEPGETVQDLLAENAEHGIGS